MAFTSSLVRVSLLIGLACGEQSECPAEGCAVSGPAMIQMTRSSQHKKREEKEVDVIVRFKNAEAEKRARDNDIGGHALSLSGIHMEFLRVNESGYQSLMNDPDLLVEEDRHEPINAQVHSMGRSYTRRSESLPYGIAMVRNDTTLVAPGPRKIKVCVADTGYDLGHVDLPTAPCAGGDDSTANGAWDNDGHGHGTHCSGTVGAIGQNDIGVDSINYDPDKYFLQIGKALSDSGSGSLAGVMAAVMACKDSGANIISLSLGGGGYSATTEASYKDVFDSGILIVAAAGNGGSSSKLYPASYANVLSVAAIDSNKNKASFSQWNNRVGIAAPGVNIESTLPDDKYASWSGTSMATPHVAGVAAFVWSHHGNCTHRQIRNVLLKTAEDLGEHGCDHRFGHGLVNQRLALQMLDQQGCSAGDIPDEKEDAYNLAFCDMVGYPPPIPTPAPTPYPVCDENRRFHLTILIDNYGEETTWKLRDESGGIVQEGSGYPSNSENSWIGECLDNDQTYTFTIEDGYGDGICCSYGNGYYQIDVGNFHHKGGDYGDGETIDIPAHSPCTSDSQCGNDDKYCCDGYCLPMVPCSMNADCTCGVCENGKCAPGAPGAPTPAPAPSPLPPTSAPTPSPTPEATTSAPTPSPTPEPTTSAPTPDSGPSPTPDLPDCDGSCRSRAFVLEMSGEGTMSWMLTGESGADVYLSGTSDEGSGHIQHCLEGGQYKFTIWGSGDGQFSLTVNGNSVQTDVHVGEGETHHETIPSCDDE